MRFKIEIVVNYDEASIDLTPEEMEHRLEAETYERWVERKYGKKEAEG